MEIPRRYRSSVGVSLEGICFPGEISPHLLCGFMWISDSKDFHVLRYGDSIPDRNPSPAVLLLSPRSCSCMDTGWSLLLPSICPDSHTAMPGGSQGMDTHREFPRE